MKKSIVIVDDHILIAKALKGSSVTSVSLRLSMSVKTAKT
jgi:hypothetical protein